MPGPLKSAARRFLQSRAVHTSQAGQDCWVFGEAFNEARDEYFVDIGAHNGVSLSNTYLLERRYGWRGICVEANPDTFEDLRRNRRVICVNACVDSVEREVAFDKAGVVGGIVSPVAGLEERTRRDVVRLKTRTLQSILVEHKAPQDIAYLSIDVEGAEEDVLGSFAFGSYRFKCMTVERPTTSLRRTLEENGYALVREIRGLDCFYVHQSFLEQYHANLFAFYEKKYLGVRVKCRHVA
jgi:FkbM family methyltransferase